MGRRVVKQPNGLYAVWSSEMDAFCAWNLDVFGLQELFVRQAVKRAAEELRRSVELADDRALDEWDACVEDYRDEWDEAPLVRVLEECSKVPTR